MVLLTAAAMTAAPLGQSAAGFSANAASAGNAWSTAASFPVDLRTAAAFAVLAGTQIDKSSSSYATGKIRTSPGTRINGFPPGQIDGTREPNTAVAITAQNDAAMTYTSLSTRRPTAVRGAKLTGTAAPGIYASRTGSFTVDDTLRLDGGGNPDAVFNFQASQRLTTAAGTTLALINAAKASNIYWSVGTTVAFGSDSAFAGTIVARGTITADKRATILGRFISTGGGVTLNQASVSLPR